MVASGRHIYARFIIGFHTRNQPRNARQIMRYLVSVPLVLIHDESGACNLPCFRGLERFKNVGDCKVGIY